VRELEETVLFDGVKKKFHEGGPEGGEWWFWWNVYVGWLI
jgi:hypothetical protein